MNPQFNLETNVPVKGLHFTVFSNDPERSHEKHAIYEDISSGYNAACWVLSEIIDGVTSKIELKTQEQAWKCGENHCITSCTVSSIAKEEDDIQNYKSEIPKGSDTQEQVQLRVCFASPLQSGMYTLSPSLGLANTVDITPEIDVYENEQVKLNQVISVCDIESDITAVKSMSDSRDLSPVAAEDSYSNPVVSISFHTSKLNDSDQLRVSTSKPNEAFEVQSNSGGDRMMPVQITHRINSEKTLSEEELESSIQDTHPSEKRLCEEKGNEMINSEEVVIYNNSYKKTSSYETTPGDCKTHYPTKQMLPKIEQDVISGSCDLFDSTDNERNTYSACIQTAATVNLFSPSPQVSTELSCHGNEMENQKQSNSSDSSTTNKSSRDLLAPDLDDRESLVVSNTEAKNIVHCQSDQSTKFASSAELLSQTPHSSRKVALKSRPNRNECKPNGREEKQIDQWQHDFTNLDNSEPYREIVKLIFDHPNAKSSLPQTNQMNAPILKSGVTQCQINHSCLQNKRTNETPINKHDQQEELTCKVDSTNLTHVANICDGLFRPDPQDYKGTNQICEVNVRQETTLIIHSIPEKCHANRDIYSNALRENISIETTKNTTQFHQNPELNDEMLLIETSPTEEVRKIDGDYAQENHVIDGHIGCSVKDSTQQISPERPITESLVNVPYQCQQRYSDCYLTVNPENKMTNEMCVSPMQIKANKLQTVPMGLSAGQENFLEEINLDSLSGTSGLLSKNDLLLQMTATRQSTPTEPIPLKLYQYTTLDRRYTETIPSRAKSDYPVSEDKHEETTVYYLPEIQGSTSNLALKEVGGNSTFNKPSTGVIRQDLQNNPILQAQFVGDNDDNFPDSGISNSSQSNNEVIMQQVDCTENGKVRELNMCLLEVPQWSQGSRRSLQCSVNMEKVENIDDTEAINNSKLEIEQLVSILVSAVCGEENASKVEEFSEGERIEKAEDDEAAYHSYEELVVYKEIEEVRIPFNKVRKLHDRFSEGTSGNDDELQKEIDKPSQDTCNISKDKLNGEGVTTVRPVKDTQVDHLPLKKRNILSVGTKEEDSLTGEHSKDSFIDKNNLYDVKSGHKDDDANPFRCEMQKVFPAPSQPQYMLFDTQNDSNNEDDDDESAFGLNSILASQPQYNLLDQDYVTIARYRVLQGQRKLKQTVFQPNETDELKHELSLLRRQSSSTECDTATVTAARKLTTEDQQVPVELPLTQLLHDQTSENTTIYPKTPGNFKPLQICLQLLCVIYRFLSL